MDWFCCLDQISRQVPRLTMTRSRMGGRSRLPADNVRVISVAWNALGLQHNHDHIVGRWASPGSSGQQADEAQGQGPWHPTSREKRARYGAPGVWGEGQGFNRRRWRE